MSTNSNSPKISYVKAIDIYLGICFANVFASLLQSAVIGAHNERLWLIKRIETDPLENVENLRYPTSQKSSKN